MGWRVADMGLGDRSKWNAIIAEDKQNHSSWNVRAGRDFSASNPHFVDEETEAQGVEMTE